LAFVDPTLHINGSVELNSACNACHGSDDSNAPPIDLLGNTDPASPGVGAHQAHLAGSGLGRTLACDECHVVPTAVDDAGHLDSTVGAELDFSGVAATGGNAVGYDDTALTCSGTWCHGPSDPAASVSPEWTSAGPLGCTDCHGLPPAAPHVNVTICYACHTNVTDSFQFVDPDLHINGEVDF
jgi:predicted CxxxxCH...CXXCH cytochrome family protein